MVTNATSLHRWLTLWLTALAALLVLSAPARADDVSAAARGVVRVVVIATVDGEMVDVEHGTGFAVAVEQSFGNCPRYIRPRPTTFAEADRSAPAPVASDRLDRRTRALVTGADTLFVASYAEADGHRQVDVSHRGGPPGFVRVGSDGTLTVPDYAGNRFFNTLGNMAANPRAGIAVPDFSSGDLVQVTGRTELVLDSPEIAGFEGAERLWRLVPERVVLRSRALPLQFKSAGDAAFG